MPEPSEMVNLLDEKWRAELRLESKSDQSATFIWHITANWVRDRVDDTSKGEGKARREVRKAKEKLKYAEEDRWSAGREGDRLACRTQDED